MNKELLESKIIDYLDGLLNETESKEIESIIKNDQEALKIYNELKTILNEMDNSEEISPSSNLKSDFEKYLNTAEKTINTPIINLKPKNDWLKLAAGLFILLSISFSLFWITKTQKQKQELAELRDEIKHTKDLMLKQLSNQESASQRLIGVQVINALPDTDEDIIRALAHTMNTDRNTNVRLAALEALARFQNEAPVRQMLIQSLSDQKDPVIQIALIKLLVQVKERAVIKDLERLSKHPGSLKAVKEEAYKGLFKLT